ncbi:unnamed protein product [Closterium sp. Naga37s-1]|nr:unnamed protein product [Closterium sp. Naga37s-1]
MRDSAPQDRHAAAPAPLPRETGTHQPRPSAAPSGGHEGQSRIGCPTPGPIESPAAEETPTSPRSTTVRRPLDQGRQEKDRETAIEEEGNEQQERGREEQEAAVAEEAPPTEQRKARGQRKMLLSAAGQEQEAREVPQQPEPSTERAEEEDTERREPTVAPTMAETAGTVGGTTPQGQTNAAETTVETSTWKLLGLLLGVLLGRRKRRLLEKRADYLSLESRAAAARSRAGASPPWALAGWERQIDPSSAPVVADGADCPSSTRRPVAQEDDKAGQPLADPAEGRVLRRRRRER